MLRILFVIFFCVCVLSTLSGSTQKGVDPPCTSLELLCPAYLVSGSDPITLRGDVLGGKEILGDDGLRRLTYEWQISGARIISGQGTSQVAIGATSEGSKEGDCINATLQIKGLPPTCESVKSCVLRVNRNCRQPVQIDGEYRDIEMQDEKVHLDTIAQFLDKSGSNSVLYLVAYAGRSTCISEAQWRATRAKSYLIEAHHIEENRIIPVNGGFRDRFAIELFVLPNNACGPLPTPTVRASEVQISGLCINKYNQRQ